MTRTSTIQELVQGMPADAEWIDILHRLQDFVAVQDGRSDLAAGRVVSHDLVRREMKRQWMGEAEE